MNGNRPTILVDCDGVMADFVSPVLRIVELLQGRTISFEEVTEFDIAKALKMTPAQSSAMIEQILTEGFTDSLAAFEGAREGVDKLREIGDVFCVTSPFRSPYWMHERQLWLEREMGFKKSETVHTSAKQLVRGDYLIDDKLDTLFSWESSNPGGHGVLVRAPWNGPTRNDVVVHSDGSEEVLGEQRPDWPGLKTAAKTPGKEQWSDIVLLIQSAEAVKKLLRSGCAL